MRRPRSSRALAACLLAGALAAPSSAGAIGSDAPQLLSAAPGGAPGNGYSGASSLSYHGRFAAFESAASDLVPGDTNQTYDVFVRDRLTGDVVRVSVGAAGAQADAASYSPSISFDGTRIAFVSHATNLVAGDTNGVADVFVRDLVAGTTVRASLTSKGAQADGASYAPSISGDGEFVGFTTWATNLVSGDTNRTTDVYLRELATGITRRMSIAATGAPANGPSMEVSVSADGEAVVFRSDATNMIQHDTNASSDVFLRKWVEGTTSIVSISVRSPDVFFLSTGAALGNGDSYGPSIAGRGDALFVAFTSVATTLVPGDVNRCGTDLVPGRCPDVFVRDVAAGTTVRASVTDAGIAGDGASGGARISPDGSFLAFHSEAQLTEGAVPGRAAVYLRNLLFSITTMVSTTPDGAPPNAACHSAAISSGGGVVAFTSEASNLAAGDTNGAPDVFAR